MTCHGKKFGLCLLVLIVFSAMITADEDASGCQDPTLFTRMPGFHIYNCEVLQFDRFEFPVKAGKTQVVEGERTQVVYYANEGLKLPSGLQVIRNYTQAAKAVGGQVVYEFEDGGTQYAVMKIEKNGVLTWAQVDGASNGMYNLTMVSVSTMKQDVIADAATMAKSLKTSGKVALYGIYFDTDKAVLKPESDGALGEISKLLKKDAALKIYVVGHTDGSGNFDHNITLSQERAMAVISALVKRFGIAQARLKPFGCGPVSPVESNLSEGGRAKNRRVELVVQ
jgi:outer membrane protein OmpA-like peptidoglycan-associated protein